MLNVDLSGRTILLVYDVEFSRTIVAHMLDRLGAPKILRAGDGYAALRILENHPEVDAVVSDFNMPTVNGLTLLKEIRCGRAGVAPDLPFAMLTGHADKELVDIALLLDVNAFIVKPVSQDGIARRLKAIFDHVETTARPRAERVAYHDIDVENTGTLRLSVETSVEALIQAEVGLWEQDGDDALAAKAKSDPDGVDSDEFVKWRVKRTAELSSRLPFLKDMLGSELGKRIVRNIDRLIVSSGMKRASSLVDTLNNMVAAGEIGPGDFNTIITTPDPVAGGAVNAATLVGPAAGAKTEAAKVAVPAGAREKFVSLSEIPEQAILTESIRTLGGNEIFGARATLSAEAVSILRHMARMNLVHLGERDGAVGVRVLVSDVPAAAQRVIPDAVPARRVFEHQAQRSIDNIEVGETIARDIFSDSGTLFLSEGTVLTRRMTTILKDLAELNRIDGNVWIAIEEEEAQAAACGPRC